jgi:hypothetical protein
MSFSAIASLKAIVAQDEFVDGISKSQTALERHMSLVIQARRDTARCHSEAASRALCAILLAYTKRSCARPTAASSYQTVFQNSFCGYDPLLPRIPVLYPRKTTDSLFSNNLIFITVTAIT